MWNGKETKHQKEFCCTSTQQNTLHAHTKQQPRALSTVFTACEMQPMILAASDGNTKENSGVCNKDLDRHNKTQGKHSFLGSQQ